MLKSQNHHPTTRPRHTERGRTPSAQEDLGNTIHGGRDAYSIEVESTARSASDDAPGEPQGPDGVPLQDMEGVRPRGLQGPLFFFFFFFLLRLLSCLASPPPSALIVEVRREQQCPLFLLPYTHHERELLQRRRDHSGR